MIILIEKYKNRFNMPMRLNTPHKEIIGFPKYIITNKIQLSSLPFSETFKFNLEPDRISILDGYVSIDSDFLLPIVSLDIDDKKYKIIYLYRKG